MKIFKSWPKMRNYVDDLLDQLGTIIRTNNPDVPFDVTPLEYMYVAMREAATDKNMLNAEHLCSKFTFNDIMDAIVKMEPSGIIAFAAMFKSVRYDVSNVDDVWGFNTNRKCEYDKTVRETYEQMCHVIMPVVIRNLRRCEDGQPKVNLSPFFEDVHVSVNTPYQDLDGGIIGVSYDIYPFTGVLKFTDTQKRLKMKWSNGLCEKLLMSAYEVAGPYAGSDVIDKVPSLKAAYGCVNSASMLADKAVNYGAHGANIGFPLGFTVPLQRIPVEKINRMFSRYEYDASYCYDNFLSDILLLKEPGAWMIGLMYILSTVRIEDGYATYEFAGFDQMRYKARREKDIELWNKCCDSFAHSNNVVETLAKLKVIVPVEYGDCRGTVNFTDGEYDITVKYRGSF